MDVGVLAGADSWDVLTLRNYYRDLNSSINKYTHSKQLIFNYYFRMFCRIFNYNIVNKIVFYLLPYVEQLALHL
jgi:hypothetical protein